MIVYSFPMLIDFADPQPWNVVRKRVEGLPLDTVILRYSSEIGVKSRRTRIVYERHLVRNARRLLRREGLSYREIQWVFGRIYIKTQQALEAAQQLRRLFGLSSTSPAQETESNLDAIVDTVVDFAKHALREGESFAIRCTRTGDHSFTSIDVQREAGRSVLDVFKRKVHVDLEEPDVEIEVEVREKRAFVFIGRLPAAGGNPLGVAAPLVALVSGGIDSPVAAWLALRKGSRIYPLYFFVGSHWRKDSTVDAIVDVVRVLNEWALGEIRQLFLIPRDAFLKPILNKAPRPLTCVLCKRFMYRIASELANRLGAQGIVTGDIAGEQASQTIWNLAITTAAALLPIHRPLLGLDKSEVVALARAIGTLEISERVTAPCPATPPRPTTRAQEESIEQAENALPIASIVSKALDRMVRIRLT
ncbi:tRNA sulfurtransferase [archaeon]|nr:tRNA sulfurtransferase [archaeon]